MSLTLSILHKVIKIVFSRIVVNNRVLIDSILLNTVSNKLTLFIILFTVVRRNQKLLKCYLFFFWIFLLYLQSTIQFLILKIVFICIFLAKTLKILRFIFWFWLSFYHACNFAFIINIAVTDTFSFCFFCI